MLLVPALWAEEYKVSSPDGHLTATVHLVDGKLTYTVARDDRIIVTESPLGLKTTAADLTGGLELVSAEHGSLDESYTLPVGKRSHYRNHCDTLSLTVERAAWKLVVQFRVYDDGFAFRYLIPKDGGHASATLTAEASRIRIANFASCTACRFLGNPGGNNPNYPYEGLYENYTSWATLASTGDGRYNTPMLVHNGKDYLLLSEADNRGIFCTSLLKAEQQTADLSYSWTGQTKDYAVEKAHTMASTLPACTPWRMAVCGDIKTIFETTMAENLCPPTAFTDTGWIRPGVAAWCWGGADGGKDEVRNAYGGRRPAEQAHCDLAADMGWDYYLIDAGWSSSWFPDFVNRAGDKGVQCLLWQDANLSNCQEFSNNNMEATLRKWKRWGIKGIKIDFWEDDSKETMTRMENLLKAAARQQMLVNFHGCTRPSGLRRTYPHLMTQEGIHGGEQNFWAPRRNTARHHLNVLFTRNVVGAMDYTPGDFATWRGSIFTQRSMGHHMALLTAFESAIVHIAESPENLRYFVGRDIMKRLPTVWDQSLLIEGNPAQYATIARRKGDDWWVAGINVDERTCRLRLDFLDDARTYTAYIYRDGSCRSDLKFEKRQVTKGSTLTIRELSEGGFLMQLSPQDNLEVPQERVIYEAEASGNNLTGKAARKTFSSLHASGGGFVGDLGQGGTLQFNHIKAERTGPYLLTIYYITADTRKAQLLVNGQQLGDTITFRDNGDCTGTWSPEGMAWKMIPVTLQQGTNNTVTLKALDDDWAPNFDRITLHPLFSLDDAVGNPVVQHLPPSDDIFDTSGRKLQGAPTVGIYIKNGKKHISP